MTNNRRQILDMLTEGKITVDEAERLLSLVEHPVAGEPVREDRSDAGRPPPKYLRVVVESGEGEESGGKRVNIRVPMALLRAGVKLASVLPSDATAKVNEKLQEKGLDIDFGNLNADNLEELVNAMSDLEVDVQGGEKKVRIFVE